MALPPPEDAQTHRGPALPPAEDGQAYRGTAYPDSADEGQAQRGTAYPDSADEGQAHRGTAFPDSADEGQAQRGTALPPVDDGYATRGSSAGDPTSADEGQATRGTSIPVGTQGLGLSPWQGSGSPATFGIGGAGGRSFGSGVGVPGIGNLPDMPQGGAGPEQPAPPSSGDAPGVNPVGGPPVPFNVHPGGSGSGGLGGFGSQVGLPGSGRLPDPPPDAGVGSTGDGQESHQAADYDDSLAMQSDWSAPSDGSLEVNHDAPADDSRLSDSQDDNG
jgi:hypothetical protein